MKCHGQDSWSFLYSSKDKNVLISHSKSKFMQKNKEQFIACHFGVDIDAIIKSKVKF